MCGKEFGVPSQENPVKCGYRYDYITNQFLLFCEECFRKAHKKETGEEYKGGYIKMSRYEKIQPIDTIGGRLQKLRLNKFSMGKIEFHNLICPQNDCIQEGSKIKNIYNWESNKVKLDTDTIIQICNKCKCSADWLLGIDF